jgi:hypothetical protein
LLQGAAVAARRLAGSGPRRWWLGAPRVATRDDVGEIEKSRINLERVLILRTIMGKPSFKRAI